MAFHLHVPMTNQIDAAGHGLVVFVVRGQAYVAAPFQKVARIVRSNLQTLGDTISSGHIETPAVAVLVGSAAQQVLTAPVSSIFRVQVKSAQLVLTIELRSLVL